MPAKGISLQVAAGKLANQFSAALPTTNTHPPPHQCPSPATPHLPPHQCPSSATPHLFLTKALPTPTHTKEDPTLSTHSEPQLSTWAMMQAVHDKVMENSALLKELWEGRRHYKDLHLTLQREREQAKAMQLEYDQFRHQVRQS